MANIKQIAALASVSTATVSHVLNQTAKVSPKLRERVLKVVKDLNYIPSSLPRSLKTKVSKTVGMVITDITNPFYGAVVRGAEDVLARDGYTVLVGNSDGVPQKEENYYRTFVAKCVDGFVLITCPAAYPPAYFARHNVEERPVVLINRDYPGLRADAVLSDSEEGSCRAVSHLLESGYRRVAIIAGPTHHVSSQQRFLGYKRALLEHGIPFDTELVKEGPFDTRFDTVAGYDHATALLKLPQRPDGLFVCNAAMSMGALRAIFDQGLRCPQDVGLVSFDDLEWFNFIHPRVSAVAQPAYDLGAAAAEILIKRVSGELTAPPRRTVLPAQLIVRESSTWSRDDNSTEDRASGPALHTKEFI